MRDGFREDAESESAFAIEVGGEPAGVDAESVGLGGEPVGVDGELAGWLGFEEETDPGYVHAGIDISLDPRFRGQGLGPDAVRTAIRWLARERGHHRFTIDPSAQNERAIRAYESVGFKPVGLLRRYERDAGGSGFHDGLLMDLLIEELR